ncbi:hypothetical protein [Streptomyces sp. NPDC048252]|uniref:hypothetical protein n=1 Tax=Streptomyces sp. NPDC048252 TaxID=3154612 RepID=UPI00343D5489
MKTTTESARNWENGRSEPKSPRLNAYQRLLNGWAAKHPAPGAALGSLVSRVGTGVVWRAGFVRGGGSRPGLALVRHGCIRCTRRADLGGRLGSGGLPRHKRTRTDWRAGCHVKRAAHL